MNIDEFWTVVERAHVASKGDMDVKCDLITKQITRLSAGDVASFAEIFDSLDLRAYCWPLWGAAYVIHGGCGDDTFSDFRASLISRGRSAFEKSISDPDCMANDEIDDEEYFYEGYQYAVMEGVKSVLGKRLPGKAPFPTAPSGQKWDESTVGGQYPRLNAKFGQLGDA